MRINALGNTATDFANDDYIALDGATNGSRKMKNDSLLKVTAQNALAGNVAQAFDPTRTSLNPYLEGQIVSYEGKTYRFKNNHYGVWDASDVNAIDVSNLFEFNFVTDSPEYILLVTDTDGYLVLGITNDGNFEYGRSEKLSSDVKTIIVNVLDDVAAPKFDPERVETYKAGKCVIYDGKLMRFKVDHPTGAWIGSDAEAVLLSDLCDFNFVEANPEYSYALTDENGYLVLGVLVDGNFVYGKSKQIEQVAISETSKTKEKNILAHKIYNSSSINDEITMNNIVGNYIWVGVLVDDYYKSGYTFRIDILDGENAGVTISGLNANRGTLKVAVGKGCTKVKFIFSNASAVKVCFNAWNYYDAVNRIIKVNSSDTDPMAHFVCDGVNDEEELNEAVAVVGFSGTIEIGRGDYYIDDLPERFSGIYGAVVIGTIATYYKRRVTIKGVSKGGEYIGTRIIVHDSAFSSVPENIEACIFGTDEIQNAGVLKIYYLNISLESNAHDVVVINGQYLGALVVESCRIAGGANEWSENPPPQGSVGVRGIMGDCNGSEYEINNTYCVALYEGFQVGGEHLVMKECGTRFCYYGYTFGNYDYGSWYLPTPVTCSHPITLINCCDEGSRRLPLFAKCGVYSESGAKALQPVDMISFNLEIYNQSLVGAEETTPGSFCGRIDFVAYGASNSSKTTTPLATRGNRVDIKFWNDGSGQNFKTTNTAHKLKGTTSERLGYWAQYMQEFFDENLNKLLICIDSENQTWVDTNGNAV